MAEGPSGDRTEKATGKRREEARKKGQVARSMELNGALVLVTGVSMLLLSSGHFARLLGENSAYLFSQSHTIRADNLFGVRTLLVGNLELFLKVMAPMVVALLLVALLVNVIQVGFHASVEALAFRPEKLNPVTGCKRFFSKKTFFDLFKNLLKITLIGLIAYLTLQGRLQTLIGVPLFSLQEITDVGKMTFAVLMFKLMALMLVLALIDWSFQKWQYEENLKMSKVEVKQEHKDLEGDPQIKARVRAIQLETARKRMLADVPKADVVITNPDHLAIALKYEHSDPAPKVLAKGRNHMAEKIKKIARKARVPVIENKPLTRTLFPLVKVGGLIPENLYQAVAEVLAYVYRLRRA
jgi:flagellar biosynthetic protein FlhB